jgi:hypothetical protein
MTFNDELVQSLTARMMASGPVLVDEIAGSWLNIVRKFSPLIGATSVLVIFERTLTTNAAAFPWLPVIPFPAQPDTAVEHLRASMASVSDDAILTAHRVLLTTFIDLMTTLIGARLTVQFLHAAFPAPDADSNTEEKPE